MYKPAKNKEIAKTEIGIDPRKVVIGYGGRVSLEKDLKTLYRAFIRITKTFDNCVLLIAGGGRPELERMFRGKENVILTMPREKIKNLDTVPFPARNLLPMNKYYSFISKRKNYTILMSSRGCTFQCTFCEQRSGDIRYRSAKNVADEMEECYQRYGVREIDVFDPLFTINKKRVIEVCKEIQKRNLKLIWSCRSRVDTIDEEMLIEMKKAGCYRIYFGIESGDEQILKNIKKQQPGN